jgi:hypothetical protein
MDDFLLLDLEMSSDHSKDWSKDIERGCVVAMINMGSMIEQPLGNIFKESVGCLLRNGIQNGFIFFDENLEKQIEPSIQRYYDTLKAGFPIQFYAKKEDVPFKVEIKRSEQGYDFVSVYSLKPYLMKKGYGSEEEKIDVAFYVERLIELCENFAIYELKTFMD